MVTTFGCAEKGDGTLVVRGKGQLKGFETGIAEFIGGIIWEEPIVQLPRIVPVLVVTLSRESSSGQFFNREFLSKS